MSISLRIVALVGTVLLSACAPFMSGREPLIDFSQAERLPVVGEDAFYGTVIEVVQLDTDGWTTQTITAGGPDSDFSSGSAVLRLHDGTVLRIADGTPAGNSCLDLHPYEAGLQPVDASLGEEPCTVSGVFADDGSVEWFAVEGGAFRYAGQQSYNVGLIGFQGPDLAVYRLSYLGIADLAFRVAASAERLHCDEVEFVQALGEPALIASSQGVPEMVVDMATLQVIQLSCI